MNSSEFYTYLYLDPRPGKDSAPIWVGKGSGERMYDHLRGSHNPLLDRIIVKCREVGLEPVVEEFSRFRREESAFATEKFLIKLVGRRDLGLGTLCNLTDGGDGAAGCVRSAETRAKLSANTSARRPDIRAAAVARLQHPEVRAKLSTSLRGRKFSDEHRAKLSIGARGNKRCLGRKVSDETRAKLSANSGSRRPEVRAKLSINTSARRPEVRAKISASLRGRKLSDEHRAKISAALRKPETRERLRAAALGNKHCVGRRHSDEARAKMSAAVRASLANKRSTRA